MAELRYWLWLSRRRGVGATKLRELLERFSSPDAVYFAREPEYAKAGVLTAGIKSILDKDLSEAYSIEEECSENGIRIITYGDAEYPARLKNIFDPPLVLYVRGRLPVIDDEAAVAIVGTRRCTYYGLKTAERISYEIAKSGGVVVSGLARGIDTAAVKGALRAGGKVIGVLGCGADVVYPPENEKLYEDVCAVGGIITEYPPKTRPEGKNFPARNRILSGVSLGVTVIEAPERSGALITAARALEQGRDVFAIPGNIDSESFRGSNALLKEGAVLVTSGREIMDEYRHLFPEKLLGKSGDFIPLDVSGEERLLKSGAFGKKPERKEKRKEIDKPKSEGYIDLRKLCENLSDGEKAVVLAIAEGNCYPDDIILKTKMTAGEVMAALTMLEIGGLVTQSAGRKFTLNNT